MELTGRVALVTGAARRIGRAIALALAKAGADVVVHYGSSGGQARATCREIHELGVDSLAVRADLSRPGEIADLFAAVEGRFGRLDILVNSAASFHRAPLEEIGVEAWDDVLAVNLRAPFLCIQRAAPLMRSGGARPESPAAIVNLVDLSGEYAWRGQAHHGVSKAGLLHLTRIAARELAPAIRVNAVMPGPILPPPGMAEDSPPWRRIRERVPAGRSGRPSQIGDAVLFLARNDFIYGETVRVDGGEHLLGAGHRTEEE